MAQVASNYSPPNFSIGDQVSVNLELDVFQALQAGHSGWKSDMAKCMGRVGNVVGMGPGYVEVQFSSEKWQLHPASLSKMESFQPGDAVRVLDDESSLRDLQKDHGGWVTAMAKSLGQEGVVRKVYPDKDVRVEVGGATWTFNPLCLKPKFQNRSQFHSPKDITQSLSDAFIAAVRKGDLDAMEKVLKVGGKVDEETADGKTALHIACLESSKFKVVEFLLVRGLDPNKVDGDGKTPLHLCVESTSGGQVAECVEKLLSFGCNPNAVDREGRTALWMSSEKGVEEVVRALLSSPNGIPDLNTQDLTGETPLHLASKAGHHGIVDVLLSKGADPHLQNVCGYNCLHLATLGDHEKVIRIVAQRARELINERDISGLAPIHLALFANKSKSLNTLLEYTELDRDIRFRDGETLLILACKEALYHFVEPLVEKGASLTEVDPHGNTPLHWVCSPIKPFLNPEQINDTSQIKLICESMKKTKFRDLIHLATAAFLIKHDAPFSVTNHGQKTPLDLLSADCRSYLEPYTFDISQLPECILCEVKKAIFKNVPCGHVTYCKDHASRGIKCLECRTPITSYTCLLPADSPFNEPQSAPEPEPAAAPAESKKECSICYENCGDDRKMVAFDPCGHTSCKDCSERLYDCHVCRQKIGRKIVLHIV